MTQFLPLEMPGSYELIFANSMDDRGHFVKTYEAHEFIELGLETDFVEEYYSRSYQNVLRGMHFQLPPHDHAKMVYCVDGDVRDVLLDLRRQSPTYGQALSLVLGSNKNNGVYVPRGVAHGFYITSKQATLCYKVTSGYNPDSDTGILWNSIEFDWGAINPILSPRDAQFKTLEQFITPFEI